MSLIFFEPVEVDHQDRHLVPVASAAFEFGFQSIEHGPAVDTPRKRIGVRQKLESLAIGLCCLEIVGPLNGVERSVDHGLRERRVRGFQRCVVDRRKKTPAASVRREKGNTMDERVGPAPCHAPTFSALLRTTGRDARLR